MSFSDSTFFIEISIKNFKSYIKCEDFMIQCKFCDVFTLNIKDPRKEGIITVLPKSTVRNATIPKLNSRNYSLTKSILFSSNISQLVSKMENFPIIISLLQKSKVSTNKQGKAYGKTNFFWEKPHCDLVKKAVSDNKMFTEIKTFKEIRIYNHKGNQKIAIFKAFVKFGIVSGFNFRSPINTKTLQAKKSKEICNDNKLVSNIIKNGVNYLVRSTTALNKIKNRPARRSRSCPNILISTHFNILNYIFSFGNGPLKKPVYYVGYFTVNLAKSEVGPSNNKPETKGSSESICAFNLPNQVNLSQCKQIACDRRIHRVVPPPQEPQLLLNLDSMYKECCDVTENTEEVVGGVRTKMQFGLDPCYCTCECTFGFTRKTTYCSVCGGYEKIGEDLAHKPKHELPVPCPVFHKIIDKTDILKKKDSGGTKVAKTTSKSGSSDKRSVSEKKSGSEKDKKKGTKKFKDDRFKFNYGYKAPQIGHSQCAMPCSGTLGTVPKRMGWLWTAEDVPGKKFNPQWKPGAIHKFVLRLLKIAKNPETAVAKKKKRDTGKKRRPLKRPLLVISKKLGEYTVTMETMKHYSKPRQINQHPYEDKPVLTYSIGRTDEENRARQKKKEREQRRLEKAQRIFIQSAFRDMCKEICVKTYQQALGILPGTEDPNCVCYPAEPGPDNTNMNVSCSCSEDSQLLSSDTDSDEWIVEFTPPNASFDPSFKPKKVLKIDNTSQYTYLDFRVKLLDRYGKPVPRFFKGPNGKEQCSDLGGFWSPDHKWLEINVDGFVGPDERWAPNIFIGPSGEMVDAETGKFQAQNGKWLTVGVDGYVNEQGKWHFYPKSRSKMSQKKQPRSYEEKNVIQYKKTRHLKKTESKWSCLGDVSPKKISEMGITGHGTDRKLILCRLQEMLARGEPVKIPQPYSRPSVPKRRKKNTSQNVETMTGRGKCTHAVPSDKGIEAIDEYGNKTYFRLRRYQNRRPNQRLTNLAKQGISLSSFHVPCLRSFISCEVMKKEQRQRLKALAAKQTTR